MATALRRVRRLLTLAGISLLGLLEYLLVGWWRPAAARVAYQGRWLNRYARWCCRGLGIELAVFGRAEPVAMLVSNHLGYLDILVLGAVAPMRFVAKAEVRGWPWFGWLARCGGTLFVRREQSRGLLQTAAQLRVSANDGHTVAVFPEATSTAGDTVRPFRSGLLAAAAGSGWLVQPAGLRYAAPGADVRTQVCWWGEMTLLPHLWELVGLERIRAEVVLGRALYHWDRKELARRLHRAVQDLTGAPASLGTGWVAAPAGLGIVNRSGVASAAVEG